MINNLKLDNLRGTSLSIEEDLKIIRYEYPGSPPVRGGGGPSLAMVGWWEKRYLLNRYISFIKNTNRPTAASSGPPPP